MGQYCVSLQLRFKLLHGRGNTDSALRTQRINVTASVTVLNEDTLVFPNITIARRRPSWFFLASQFPLHFISRSLLAHLMSNRSVTTYWKIVKRLTYINNINAQPGQPHQMNATWRYPHLGAQLIWNVKVVLLGYSPGVVLLLLLLQMMIIIYHMAHVGILNSDLVWPHCCDAVCSVRHLCRCAGA